MPYYRHIHYLFLTTAVLLLIPAAHGLTQGVFDANTTATPKTQGAVVIGLVGCGMCLILAAIARRFPTTTFIVATSTGITAFACVRYLPSFHIVSYAGVALMFLAVIASALESFERDKAKKLTFLGDD